jgi:signal transduction histidine kinase
MGDTALLLRNGNDVRPDHVVDVDVPASPVWIEADDNQIRQIVWNLATNGLRAMATGGRLHLEVESSDEHTAAFRVEDQGCGIEAAEIDRIFQPFRSSFDKGTGLGLATVHRIVTDCGGSIRVTSSVGVGTTMRIQLPLQPAAAGRPEAVPVAVRIAG